MFGLKKKKVLERIVPGLSRSEDSRLFFIPKITDYEDKVTLKRRFISPVFGKNVKDEVVLPHDARQGGDIDKRYDPFRKNKKLTKEEAKRRYGDAYYEFNTITNKQKDKMVKGELDPEDIIARPREQILQETSPQMPKEVASQVSIDDFFDAVEPSTVEDTYTTLEEMTRNIKEPDGDFDLDRFSAFVEEDVELFAKNEPVKAKEETPKRVVIEEDERPTLATPSEVPFKKTYSSSITDYKDYYLPPVSLMKKSPIHKASSDHWIQANIDIINQTLLAFDIGGEVSTFTKGPTVTRYEITLAAGVQTKKITSIADNIQMNLAAHTIRIEAPIPGKTTVGIEVPNKERESVFFGDVIDNPKFLLNQDPLLLAIGLDIDANPVYTSIEAMPHGLVAGSTQSGKSVAIASIIASILYKNKPDQVKLLLIDPKKVDLQQFADIPHLVTPIIDETKMALEALKWTVGEMERRYDVLKKFKSVNVKDYYERRIHDRDFEKMPRLVIIVEEASDLLLNGGPEVEENILKLTQKSRAVGIHLILATQRPSADIIKGSIKANIPTRFAFKVPTQVDSSVVLDTPGAEKLLGRGDMLLSENGLIRRLQGAFLSPQEIESLVEFIKNQAHPAYIFTHETLVKTFQDSQQSSELDELFGEVARYVVLEEKCSLNKITQEFNIGFNRATQIVSSLELYGVVSRNVGTKPREVMVNELELQHILEGLGQQL
jgi:DNA segregation ATPase FtsK/SpoIIIE, S-DNA-T family